MDAFFQDIIAARATEEGKQWLNKALEAARNPGNPNVLLGYYAGAARRMGKVALNLSDAEKARLAEQDSEISLDHWGLDEATRVLLLLNLSKSLSPDDYQDWVFRCYESGDSREQESWLRGLAVIPGGDKQLHWAMDATRTNIIPVFEAIACENPYPTRYFPELNFNQMVLKALFVGVSIWRIFKLESRFNADLSRMSDDYITEREVAGRTVPVDIWLAVCPYGDHKALERAAGYLDNDDPNHRLWAATGLGHAGNKDFIPALEARGKVEPEADVKKAIETALSRLG